MTTLTGRSFSTKSMCQCVGTADFGQFRNSKNDTARCRQRAGHIDPDYCDPIECTENVPAPMSPLSVSNPCKYCEPFERECTPCQKTRRTRHECSWGFGHTDTPGFVLRAYDAATDGPIKKKCGDCVHGQHSAARNALKTCRDKLRHIGPNAKWPVACTPLAPCLCCAPYESACNECHRSGFNCHKCWWALGHPKKKVTPRVMKAASAQNKSSDGNDDITYSSRTSFKAS